MGRAIQRVIFAAMAFHALLRESVNTESPFARGGPRMIALAAWEHADAMLDELDERRAEAKRVHTARVELAPRLWPRLRKALGMRAGELSV